MFHIMFSFMLLLCSTTYISCSAPKKNKNYPVLCCEQLEGKNYFYVCLVKDKDIQNLCPDSIKQAVKKTVRKPRLLTLMEKLHNYDTTFKEIEEKISDFNVEDIFCINKEESIFCINHDNGEKIKIDTPGAREKLYAGTHILKALVSRKNI